MYLVLLAMFAIAFIVGMVNTLFADGLSRGNRLDRQLLDRYGRWAAWIGALGIIAVGLRYTNVSLFSKRLWTFLDLLAMIGVAGHIVWYRLRRYPADLATYEEAERRRKLTASRRPPAARRSARRRA